MIKSGFEKIGKQKGFTLIEIITVISVIVVIGSIMTGIFFSVLRNSAKTGVNTAVAQNGNYALSVISNLILNSRSLTLPLADANGQNIANRTVCPVLPLRLKQIDLLSTDGGTTTLICQDSGNSNNNIASSSSLLTLLIDTSQVSLKQNSCNIYCSQSDLFSPPRIDIEFTLASSGTSSFQENIAGATNFRTSVTLRNYQSR